MRKLDLPDKLAERVLEGEGLARHTTLRIGGPAELYLRVNDRSELIAAVSAASASRLPFFVLGHGSNILVSDTGIRGLVVENHSQAFNLREEGKHLTLVAESGASLPGLANQLSRQGWTGLEWAIGVPSTMGAAVVGNAGAHGRSIADSLRRAEVIDMDGATEWWDRIAFEFSYRNSHLKLAPGKWVVLQVDLELERDETDACIARMNAYSEHRRRTQPTEPSVGSMFKNPPGDHAGRLIEAAGLKGTRIGNIQVSPVHANFFVNLGGATAKDVIALIERVRDEVKQQSGVELELEIQLIGDLSLATA